MTNQEAIDLLDNLIGMIEDNHDSDYDSAIRMAIDALESKWTLCSEKMPEEHEWIGTKKFGTTRSDEVHVTFEAPNGDRFVKTLSFQNGELSAFEQRVMDSWHGGSKPIAWMNFPEPYKESSDEIN